jgi:hypothetical protein
MSSSLVNVEVAGQNTRPLGRLQPEGRTHYRPAPSTRFGARSHFPGADRLRGGLLPSGIPTSLVQRWHAGSISGDLALREILDAVCRVRSGRDASPEERTEKPGGGASSASPGGGGGGATASSSRASKNRSSTRHAAACAHAPPSPARAAGGSAGAVRSAAARAAARKKHAAPRLSRRAASSTERSGSDGAAPRPAMRQGAWVLFCPRRERSQGRNSEEPSRSLKPNF